MSLLRLPELMRKARESGANSVSDLTERNSLVSKPCFPQIICNLTQTYSSVGLPSHPLETSCICRQRGSLGVRGQLPRSFQHHRVD